MNESLRVFLSGIVDYAGLFPPAKLDMASAVQEYATYLTDPQRNMLGRFVVPVSRITEFERETAAYLPRGGVPGDGNRSPWLVSALTGVDIRADLGQIDQFNTLHGASDGVANGFARIDSIETKVLAPDEIEATMAAGVDVGVGPQLEAFFEVPLTDDLGNFLDTLKRSGGYAKIRTGGITVDAFPPADNVARFLVGCAARHLPFKATAGLHHPWRAEYRLTYEPNPPMGVMYGYLNMFVAASLAWRELGESIVRDALVADATEFSITDGGITFRAHTIPVEELAIVRANFAKSFGSCSFREPVDDLKAIGLL